MATGIRKAKKGGNAVYLEIGIWFEPATGDIHITCPKSGWLHTTVNNKVGSKRAHQNLFEKLTRALKEAGAPAPNN